MKASLYLDKRFTLANGKFAIKLRVFCLENGKKRQVYYSTGQSATELEWKKIISGSVRGELRDVRREVINQEAKAQRIIQDAPFLSIDSFGAIFTNKRQSGHLNVRMLFDLEIERLKKLDRWGSVTIYTAAANAFEDLCGFGLTLDVLDKSFLEGLEQRMKLKTVTKGIYMTALRKIYNDAIQKRLISADLYPFGKRGYVIPSGTGRKNALSKENKDALFGYVPADKNEELALDVWKFMFYCNGMNMVDVCRLPVSKLAGESFTYLRQKPSATKRKPKSIRVIVHTEARLIAGKYPGKFMFGVLSGEEYEKEVKNKVKQFGKLVNRYLKKVSEKLSLPFVVTSNVARHTLATRLLRTGADLGTIRDILGHSTMQALENYLATIDTSEQKKALDKVYGE